MSDKIDFGNTIPDKKVTVYHATFTGENMETLSRFIDEGAKPLSKGAGQGDGFYVWTTKKLAIHHMEEFLESKGPGYPLIIEVQEHLDNDNWDIDFEVQDALIKAFIWGHWDLFKQIPDSAIEISKEEGYLLPSKCEKIKSLFRRAILLNYKREGSSGAQSIELKIKGGDLYEGGSVGEAIILGKIFRYLEEHHPHKTKHFEKRVFEKTAKKGIAIKYVGKKPLSISGYTMKVNGKWLSDKESQEVFKSKEYKKAS